MLPSVGDLVAGKYRIVRSLGGGGMGSVLEARHERLATEVALKFVHDELARRPGLAERFLREAQVAAHIRNVHVAQVLDVDQLPDGTPYIVMELLTGEPLAQVIRRDRVLGRDRALDFTLQILAGLEAAHAIGVVHRDLKPDNVFVTTTTHGPLLKLIDFGIAKLRDGAPGSAGLTRPGSMMGTPEYMAPEQVESADEVDARADLYAVGVMLYEMLTGVRPVQGDDPIAIAIRVRTGDVRPLASLDPTVPPGLAAVVHRAMAADASARFGSAAELRAALAPFVQTLSPAGRAALAPLTQPSAGGTPGPAHVAAASPPPRSSGVAPTWPPDALPSSGYVPPGSAVRTRPDQQTAAMPAFQSPLASPSPGGYAAPPAHAPVATSPATAPPRRGRSGLVLFLVALVLLAAAGGGVALYLAQADSDAPVPPLVFDAGPAATVALPVAPTGVPAATTAPPATTAVAPPRAQPGTVVARDAGATATDGSIGVRIVDASAPPAMTLPFPVPITLPSSLPPLPFPIPSSFPFPIPGMGMGASPAATAPEPAKTAAPEPTATSTANAPPGGRPPGGAPVALPPK